MENIDYFAELLSTVHDIYLWVYGSGGDLLRTNCPYPDRVLNIADEELAENARRSCTLHDRPTILDSCYRAMWITDSLKQDGEILEFYLIGPFYMDSYPAKDVAEEVEKRNLSLGSRQRVIELTGMIPVISMSKIIEYATMMHYAITGEKINVYDLHYAQPRQTYAPGEEDTTVHGTYEAEREMLRMVREGDIRIVEQLKRMSTTSYVGKLANDDSDSLRQMKNTILVATTLFSRAAIEGGVYPDTAMTLTDRYFQAVEAATTFQEISDIAITMETDFVSRVRKVKSNRAYSGAVRTVIDYIDLHLEEDIDLSDMASELGYSDYYLSKKFKKETGRTVKEQIRDARLERAKFILDSHGSVTVFELSQRLKFSSESYFIQCFRDRYGVTPKQYALSGAERDPSGD